MIDRPPERCGGRVRAMRQTRLIGAFVSTFLIAAALWSAGPAIPGTAGATGEAGTGVVAPANPIHKQMRVDGPPPVLATPRRLPATPVLAPDGPPIAILQSVPCLAPLPEAGCAGTGHPAESDGRTVRISLPRGPPAGHVRARIAA